LLVVLLDELLVVITKKLPHRLIEQPLLIGVRVFEQEIRDRHATLGERDDVDASFGHAHTLRLNSFVARSQLNAFTTTLAAFPPNSF